MDEFLQALDAIRIEYRNRWEHRFLIPVVEGIMRLWFHLDPRLYSEKRRLRSVENGAQAKKSNCYVLFVLYAQPPLAAFTQTLIDAVGRSALNLVIVSNRALAPGFKTSLLQQCHLLIERENLGR